MTNLEIIKYLATNNPSRLAELLDDLYCHAWNSGVCFTQDGKSPFEENDIDDFNEWFSKDAITTGLYYDEELDEWSRDINKPTIGPYEWVSVEDRLPEENTDVLIYRGGFIGDLMNVYTYKGHNEWEDEYGYWSRTEDEGITHWMPLPSPPKD